MIKYYCDKCGQEMSNGNAMTRVTVTSTQEHISEQTYMLCSSCVEPFLHELKDVVPEEDPYS